jgi:hypothetical protein
MNQMIFAYSVLFWKKRTKTALRGCRGLIRDSRARVLAAFSGSTSLLPAAQIQRQMANSLTRQLHGTLVHARLTLSCYVVKFGKRQGSVIPGLFRKPVLF